MYLYLWSIYICLYLYFVSCVCSFPVIEDYHIHIYLSVHLCIYGLIYLSTYVCVYCLINKLIYSYLLNLRHYVCQYNWLFKCFVYTYITPSIHQCIFCTIHLLDLFTLFNFQSPFHPCMVYIPTFSWFLMVNVGKHTMDPMGSISQLYVNPEVSTSTPIIAGSRGLVNKLRESP